MRHLLKGFARLQEVLSFGFEVEELVHQMKFLYSLKLEQVNFLAQSYLYLQMDHLKLLLELLTILKQRELLLE